MAAAKSTTISFDEDVFNLIHRQAELAGQTPAEFIHRAV